MWLLGRPMPRSHGTNMEAACPSGTRYRAWKEQHVPLFLSPNDHFLRVALAVSDSLGNIVQPLGARVYQTDWAQQGHHQYPAPWHKRGHHLLQTLLPKLYCLLHKKQSFV